jgi:glycosyltransferase involved in cell wall biosynthesis
MRISIVTPSFQQVDFLEETILSVSDQTHDDVEHIVVDGGSADGSAQIISRYKDRLAWSVCEKDRGQSHAINKGLDHVTGHVFNWINSDDLLTPDALTKVHREFEDNPDLLALCGQLIHRSASGDMLFDKMTDSSEPTNYFVDHIISQPATFLRASAVKAVGGVDENLRYVMDYELWLQLLFRFGTDSIKQCNRPLAVFRLHEDSKTTTAHAGFLQEIASILHGLCTSSGNEGLGEALATGYEVVPGLRGIPDVGAGHHELVRRMVLHFIFKWNGSIGTKNQFRMVRIALEEYGHSPVELKPELIGRIYRLREDLNVANWNLFRVKRKLLG